MNSLAFYTGLVPMVAISAVLVVSFFGYGAYWLTLSPEDRTSPEKGAGRDRGFFVAYFYALIGPVCRLLTFLRITPNAVTLASLLLAIGGAVALAYSEFMLAASLIVCASSADAVDGFLARAQGNGSQAGAFLDSFIDRLTEGVVFIGFVWLGDGGIMALFATTALVSSYAVSYARARGESLGATGKVGVMQRPVRLVFVATAVFTLAWGQLVGGGWSSIAMTVATGIMGILAVGASVTAFRRARFIYDELLPPDAEVSPIRPPTPDDDRLEKAAS
jgi:CDP-diacylglycerol--glycerol-3-phosphate 3-phosphatidyltransferase